MVYVKYNKSKDRLCVICGVDISNRNRNAGLCFDCYYLNREGRRWKQRALLAESILKNLRADIDNMCVNKSGN